MRLFNMLHGASQRLALSDATNGILGGRAAAAALPSTLSAAASAPASTFESASSEPLWGSNIFDNDGSGEELYESSGFAMLWNTDSNNNNVTFNTTEFVMASANGILLRTITPLQDVTTVATNSSSAYDPYETHENNYWGLLALVLVFATAAGNILVCLAIYLERRLQNVTNYFLMSLAITDLMVAVLVMPLGILTLVKGEWGKKISKLLKLVINHIYTVLKKKIP